MRRLRLSKCSIGWLAISLLLFAFGWATPAQAAACPKGHHSKMVGDKTLSMEYVQVCVPHKPGDRGASNKSSSSSGGLPSRQAVPTEQRFCRVGGRLEGISRGEMDAGSLLVDGNRWVVCPPQANVGEAESVTLDLGSLARSLTVQLRLPDATPVFSPDPGNNEWKMLAVGFPVWLRTNGPDARSTTASTQGLTFLLRATRVSTTFAMGDGSTVTCTAMARYSNAVKAGSASPNCGHIYQQPSGKKGHYTVTGTHHWRVTWSVDGFSGSFPLTYSDSATIRIGELSALNR